MNQVWSVFNTLINQRLASGTFTTEDSVRYTFFFALLEAKFCKHTDVILEIPHPTISKAEVDLFIRAGDSRPATAFEFKYDRPIPSQTNVPRTQKAGAVFKDLFRLAHIAPSVAQQRFFIYVAAYEMVSYFSNPSNGLTGFYNLPVGNTFAVTPKFINSFSATFQKEVGSLVTSCSIISVYQQNLSNQHFLRIYQV